MASGTGGAGVADVLLSGEEFSGKCQSVGLSVETYKRENKRMFMFNYGYGLTEEAGHAGCLKTRAPESLA
jgi:hypothetical protein